MSARALTCVGTASIQSGPHELTGSLASSRDTARNTSHKARRPSVEPTLAIDLRVTFVFARTEMIRDDLVEELRHASMRVARLLLEGRFRRGRNAPRIDFSLSSHALQCNAILMVNQSRQHIPDPLLLLEMAHSKRPHAACSALRGRRLRFSSLTIERKRLHRNASLHYVMLSIDC